MAPRTNAALSGDARIFSAYTVSATFWLLLTTAAGVLMSFKFPFPDLATSPYLSFGRLRAIHTNGTFYGWASIALVGAALYVAARSSGVTISNKRFAWLGLWLLNAAVVAGTIALDLGVNYGDQEYREWVWPIRLLLLFGVASAGWSIVKTVAARAGQEIYISNWYTIGGTVFTAILVIVALIPWYQIGLGQVAVQAFFMHNAVGMWFTFLALGVTYYALPKLLNRPIYSYALGILGFWTNLIFYPIIGAHHFEFTPLPWWFQTLAIVFSVGMLVPVVSGTANFFLTMRAHGETIRRSYALPFIVVGVAYYFLGSSQGTVEAFRSLQTIWHFTNFTIGHSHATMYGFITFIAWGAIYALLPRATGRQPNLLVTGLHFWLATIGVTLYVVALSVAGTLQGLDWAHGNPFIASVEAAQPYWVWRAIAGSMMFLSHLLFAYNVWLMTAGGSEANAPAKAVRA
ncbi:MAG: cbb3-type cytochrome c oxidase subunit I [Candidatus Tyrphobacter sp.]